MLSPLDNKCHEQSCKNGYTMPVKRIWLEYEPYNRVAPHNHKGSWACNPNTRQREELSKTVAGHASRTRSLPQSSMLWRLRSCGGYSSWPSLPSYNEFNFWFWLLRHH